MGQGIPVEISNEPDKEWTGIKSNGVMAFFVEKVCIWEKLYDIMPKSNYFPK